MTERPWYAQPGSDRRARHKEGVERMQRERSPTPPPVAEQPKQPRKQSEGEFLAEYIGSIILLWAGALLVIGIIVEIAS